MQGQFCRLKGDTAILRSAELHRMHSKWEFDLEI